MELLAALAVAVLFGAGTYLMLARNMLRVVLGSALLTYATNLLLLASGLLKRGRAPVLTDVPAGARFVDPIPQALILTAIVIGFGVTAFLFVLAYKAVQAHGTDDLADLRGGGDD